MFLFRVEGFNLFKSDLFLAMAAAVEPPTSAASPSLRTPILLKYQDMDLKFGPIWLTFDP